MRKKLLGIAVGAALLLPSAASAAVLPYGGFIALSLGDLPGLVVPGGSVGIVNGSLGGPHVTTLSVLAGAFGPATQVLVVTASATVGAVAFTAVANAPGLFVGGTGPSLLGGPMGLTGTAQICLFTSTCLGGSVLVPLTGGLGAGTATQTLPGFIALTLQHQVWTQGLATVTIHDAATTTGAGTGPPPTQHAANTNTLAAQAGFAHGAASGTSSTTAAQSGVIQLVTVTKAWTSLTGAFPELPLFGILTLHFTSGDVPEPGTLLLLGAGVAGLVAVGRKKRS